MGARLRRVADVQAYPLGEELLLYAPARRTAHTLSPSARAIWERCDGSKTVEEISRALATPLGLAGDDLEPDVIQAVSQLAELGLLEAV
jgi:hypothetical protein